MSFNNAQYYKLPRVLLRTAKDENEFLSSSLGQSQNRSSINYGPGDDYFANSQHVPQIRGSAGHGSVGSVKQFEKMFRIHSESTQFGSINLPNRSRSKREEVPNHNRSVRNPFRALTNSFKSRQQPKSNMYDGSEVGMQPQMFSSVRGPLKVKPFEEFQMHGSVGPKYTSLQRPKSEMQDEDVASLNGRSGGSTKGLGRSGSDVGKMERLGRGQMSGKELYLKRKNYVKKELKKRDSSFNEFSGGSRGNIANGDPVSLQMQSNTPQNQHYKQASYSGSSGGDSGIRTEQSSSAGGVVASHMLGASMSDEYEIGMRANGPGGKGGKKHGKGNHRSASASRNRGSTDEDMDNNFTLIYGDRLSAGDGVGSAVSVSSRVSSVNNSSSADFTVEHLTSFTMSREDALWTVDDAIRKLKLQDVKNKIWSQEMKLRVSGDEIKLYDINSSELIDRFPYSGVAHVEAVVIKDYHLESILAIIYTDMTGRKPEIYLFHCDHCDADEVTSEIKLAMEHYHRSKPSKYAKAAQKSKVKQSSLNGSQQRLSGYPVAASPVMSRSAHDLSTIPQGHYPMTFYNPNAVPASANRGSISGHSSSPANSQAKRSGGRITGFFEKIFKSKSEPDYLEEFGGQNFNDSYHSHSNGRPFSQNERMSNGLNGDAFSRHQDENHQHISLSYHANGANSFEEDFYTDDVVDNLDDTLVASASVSSRDTSSGSHHHDSKSESRKQLAVRMERQVDILNHCFDDIEAFAQKLKHVHDAQKELDMRRQKKKNKQKLDNMLEYRAKMPPQTDFIDAFQKFKLAFNLLAPLKKLISDPSAPELVHHLFPPLSRIVNDPNSVAMEIAKNVYSPLLTQGAVDLLKGCLSTDEKKLWNDLGNAWNVPRESWPKEHFVPAYVPVFLDGWKPPPLIDSSNSPRQSNPNPSSSLTSTASPRMPPQSLGNGHARPSSFAAISQSNTLTTEFSYSDSTNHFHHRESRRPSLDVLAECYHDYSGRRLSAIPPPPQELAPLPRAVSTSSLADPLPNRHSMPVVPPPSAAAPTPSSLLKSSPPSTVVVKTDFVAGNYKELTVRKGEVLEIVDSTRKWWAVKNTSGQTGYVPNVILSSPSIGGGSTQLEPTPTFHHHMHNIVDTSNKLKEQQVFNTHAAATVQPQRTAVTQNGPPAPPGPPAFAIPAPPPPPPPEALQPKPVVKQVAKPKAKPAGKAITPKKEEPQKEINSVVTLNVKSKGSPLKTTPSTHSGGDNSKASVINYESTPKEVYEWLASKGFSSLTVEGLGILNGSQLFSLSKDEFMEVCFHDGPRVHSFVTVQKSLANSASAANSSSGIGGSVTDSYGSSAMSTYNDPLTQL
ncbi:uncharacterized protein LOC134846304 isoform X3 [Symsagittifera roscoffensis]|uniref:uncharacterized protein LOC134846304 isoform X3 n=1 Tax=Symsagittifera roscoffensis TaxID=84072 RepID=UPI00307B3F6B